MVRQARQCGPTPAAATGGSALCHGNGLVGNPMRCRVAHGLRPSSWRRRWRAACRAARCMWRSVADWRACSCRNQTAAMSVCALRWCYYLAIASLLSQLTRKDLDEDDYSATGRREGSANGKAPSGGCGACRAARWVRASKTRGTSPHDSRRASSGVGAYEKVVGKAREADGYEQEVGFSSRAALVRDYTL